MNGTRIISYSLLDELNGLPPSTEPSLSTSLSHCIFACLLLFCGCSRLLFDRVAHHIVLSTMLLVGWGIGYVCRFNASRVLTESLISDELIKNTIPILYFNTTYKVDYHTLANSIMLILLVCIPVVFFHYLTILLITMTVIDSSFVWGMRVIWLFAVSIGIIHAEHCISELNKVQGQMRILQLVLIGERLIACAVASVIQNVIERYYNPNLPFRYHHFPFFVILGWTLMTILISVIFARIFKWSLKYFYKDIVSQITTTFGAIYFLFWLMEGVRASGSLAVLVFGITLGYCKVKYSSASERFFKHFWDLCHFILTAIVTTSLGFYLGSTPHWVLSEMFGFVFLIYILVLMARGLGYIVVYPFVKHLGVQISMKHFVIATMGVSRSCNSLAYCFLDRNFTHGYALVLFACAIWLTSVFFNVVLLQRYLNFFEMYKMSRTRLVNMNIAINQVNECREKSIRSLKMDRLIADSNWVIVDRITKLEHPYTGKMVGWQTVGRITDSSTVKSSRLMNCGDCGALNDIPPTELEFEAIRLEAKQRILKAQLVCFWKQYDNGTLSRQGVTILNNLIESAAVKEDPKLTYKDLRIQRDGSKTLRFLKALFGHLFTVTSVTHRFIPTNIIRATCFRLHTWRTYQTTMACLSLVDTIILAAMLHMYYFQGYLNEKETYSRFFQLCDIIFYIIFLVDFLVSILGIGVIQYFHSHVNKIEFAVGLLIRSNQLAMYCHTCVVHNSFFNVFLAHKIIFLQKLLMVVRISRTYIFIVTLIPKIMVSIDRKLDRDIMRYYDIGKAYLIALNRVAYFLNHIADNEKVHRELLNDVETDRQSVTWELGMIQKNRPTIAVSNKTLHAVRHVIISMGDCVSSMRDEGLLDPTENRSLQISLDKVKRRLLQFKLVEPSSPDRILLEIPWLKEDYQTVLLFLKHSKLASFQEGEKIIYYGDDSLSLYIIVSGMVKCSYISSEAAVKMVAAHGMLPNCDYFTNLEFNKDQDELIVGGNVLGEMGILTGRRYDMEVVCETRVQMLYVPWKILKAVVHDSRNSQYVQAKMWKSIGIKIAIHLLHNASRFQGWHDYKILLYLQRGIVPSLNGVDSLHMSELISDVILIQGKLMDYSSRKVFIGPCCVPRLSSQRLVLPNTPLWDVHEPCDPQLLIIPNAEAEMEEIMSNEGLFKYCYQDLRKAQGCTGHLTKNYISRLIQAQRRRRMVTHFLDYMPTVFGPVENFPVSTTYIEKVERSRVVKAGAHPKTREVGNLRYTQDIEEQSEIELMKDEVDDDEYLDSKSGSRHRTSSRSQKKVRRKKSSSSGAYNERMSSYMNSSYSPVDGPKQIEILVVENVDSEEDNQEHKETQTSIHMVSRRVSMPNFGK